MWEMHHWACVVRELRNLELVLCGLLVHPLAYHPRVDPE
jgi:hypothetical protein